jgi:hypothetical protein
MSTRKCLQFLYILKRKINSALTESTQSDKSFDYLGKFDFIFKTNLGSESGDQVGAFYEKKQKQKISCKCTFKQMRRARELEIDMCVRGCVTEGENIVAQLESNRKVPY